jgi:hypothetical protein
LIEKSTAIYFAAGRGTMPDANVLSNRDILTKAKA